MTNRDWFCLVLRLFGIYLLIDAVEFTVPNLLYIITAGELGPELSISYIVYFCSWLIVLTGIGLVLVIFAPAITARFYPGTATKETTHSDDEVKLLKVGIQLLAVYALLLAVQHGAGVIIGLLQSDNYGSSLWADFNGAETGYLSSFLNFGLNVAFAAVLLMWNDRIVSLITKIRYVPDRDADKPPPVGE